MAVEDDVEMRWIGAWNDVYEIAGEQWDMQCQLPDGQVVNPESCRGWLQKWFIKAGASK